MMHIVLLILKIIGIILLSLLGILLLLALTLLLVPLRYHVSGEWRGEAKVQARVHWFLCLLSFCTVYDQKRGLLMKLRVFGVPVWSSDKEEPVKDAVDSIEHLKDDGGNSLTQNLEREERRYLKSAKKMQEMDKALEKKSLDGRKGGAKKAADGEAPSRPLDTEAARRAGEEPGTGARRAKSPKLKPMIVLIKKIAAGARKALENLLFSFRRIYDKLKGGCQFIQEQREWLENEKNQASLRFLWKQAGRVLTHLRPTKGRGTISFGFEDPYTTGRVLQGVSLIYPFCHRQLSIQPVFDEKILEGEGSFTGRIRLGFLLWLAVQIYFDRHTRKLIQSFIK